MFKCLLNGIDYGLPQGIEEMEERVYYNAELSMYLTKLDGDAIFIEDAYNYLRQQFTDNICSIIDVELQDSRTNKNITGVIFLNDVEWNLSKRMATCKIVTDSFIEKINNNKGIKVQLGVGLTKNLEFLQSVRQTDIYLPNITDTGGYLVYGYRIFDVFRELVQFMTDNDLTVVSDYFDPLNGNEAAYSVIVRGVEVREFAHEATPLISFQDFWNDINKLHNIAGVIEGNALRIEPKSYFRNNEIHVTIENIDEVVQESYQEQFYASIKMGSAKVAETFDYLIRLSYNGFTQEQFFLEGQCNIENELDLQLQTLITDANIVQDVQPIANSGNNNADYDADILLIHCDSTNQAALAPAPLAPGNFYYNDYFTNRSCSERWSETYPFSILQLLESEQPLVRATLTTNQVAPNQSYLACDDDTTPPNFDTGGDYQVGLIPVTPAPFSATVGYFEAPTDMVVSVAINLTISGAYQSTRLNIVDNTGANAGSQILIDQNPFITISQQYYFFTSRLIEGSATFYMPAGSRVFCVVDLLNAPDSVIYSGARFEVVQLGAYGGVYKVINQNNSFVSRTDFKYKIDPETWDGIYSRPFNKIKGTYVDGQFTGFPIDISRNILTGNADVKLYQRKLDVT